ncbi:hypothetical protein U9M48_032301 [Paspalum notatum var. saurae]|uniref:Uncharacterized protein n=1 Tax=Paspalum notatum var. saurae TaxID=547442 RepID=A0AAQ3U4E9_PASNO
MATPFYVGTYFGVDMFIGTVILFAWQKLNREEADGYAMPVASGLICGDGIWSIPSAVLSILGVVPPICMSFKPSSASRNKTAMSLDDCLTLLCHEEIAYQYARKGARLALVARRERSLHDVAARAKDVGLPDVLVVAGDVSNPEDCLRPQSNISGDAMDHLVNNAGVASVRWFEEVPDVADFKQVLAVNFWGAVHPTHCALPHLKKSGGKIFVNSSAAAVLAMPRMIFYNASKAAVLNFFETLRIQLRGEVGITIATPGWIESEMTKGKHLSKDGEVEVDQDMRDVGVRRGHRGRRVCCGRRHLTVPLWYRALFLWRMLAPEMADFGQRVFYCRATAAGRQPWPGGSWISPAPRGCSSPRRCTPRTSNRSRRKWNAATVEFVRAAGGGGSVFSTQPNNVELNTL